MLKKLIIPFIIFALAIAFFKLMIATKEQSPEIIINEHVWRVEQGRVEKQSLSPVVTLYGKVESSELLNSAAPAASQVAAVLVKEGEHIDKGQLMLSLDPGDFEPTVMQAQAKVKELAALIKSDQLRHENNLKSLKNEKKLLRLSEKALARAVKVKKQNLGSVSETEQAMQLVEKQRLSYNQMQFSVNEHQIRQEQLEARLMQADADLNKSQLALKRSQIVAPFSGMVAKVNVAQGDRVNANEKLLSFYSTEHLEIRAKIPMKLLAEIQQSLAQGAPMVGEASNGSWAAGIRLNRLSGEAQASGVNAIFSIVTESTRFRIGAIVVMRLQRPVRDNMIKVPYQAMYGSDRLYQIKDNRLQAIKVKTIGECLQQNPGSHPQEAVLLVESEALKSGDTILTTHLPNAYTGLKVDAFFKETGKETDKETDKESLKGKDNKNVTESIN